MSRQRDKPRELRDAAGPGDAGVPRWRKARRLARNCGNLADCPDRVAGVANCWNSIRGQTTGQQELGNRKR